MRSPHPSYPPGIIEKMRHVRLVVLDVDGTLTDGSLYYSAHGEEMKRFHVRDGMGIVLLHRAGLQTALLTSDGSDIISTRAAKLGIPHVLKGIRNKSEALQRLCTELAISLPEVAYIGDDINDVAAMELCGLRACPADAVAAVKAISDVCSAYKGGQGAVREILEGILLAQNKLITLPNEF